jgi:hypothetical protein
MGESAANGLPQVKEIQSCWALKRLLLELIEKLIFMKKQVIKWQKRLTLTLQFPLLDILG